MILFLLKKAYDYDGTQAMSNGLRSSALFVVDMLLSEGHRAKLVEVVDANGIDAVVTQLRPNHVVLEALWVTPDKLAELQRLHPTVRWAIRVHSELPFLAQEGCAIEWLLAYKNADLAFNSEQTADDLRGVIPTIWLPNYYPLSKPRCERPHGHALQVGCFGAIRPLKNQLIQAVAALQWARKLHRHLQFHMNGERIEQHGSNNLKNIKALLGESLVLHPWLPRPEFLELVAEMDVCMQVSLSESFNITSADAVSMGVPLVGSSAIPWLTRRAQADVDRVDSIVEALERADRITVFMNHHALEDYLTHAKKEWLRYV
jgi:glycosyltransferase involved in cell wall biosynthesis